jgi:hypothetical protein
MWAANSFKGDITHNLWYDYSELATIVGWSSFTTKVIQLNYREGAVHVVINLEGTSNSTATTFTLPVNTCRESTLLLNGALFFTGTARNNGTVSYARIQALTPYSGVVGTVVTNPVTNITFNNAYGVAGGVQATWTASGIKQISSCFVLPLM